MTALPASGSFAMVDPAHVAEVGPAAAILYARIAWRCTGREQEWAATRAVLAEETGLSPDMVRTAVKVLRDRGWVTSRRLSSAVATLVWTPVFAGHVDMGKVPTPSGESPHLPDVGESPISPSVETVETLETTPPAGVEASEDAPLPFLTVVPDPPVARNAPSSEVPPQTAQTLVGRWVDGYRVHNDGQDPHPALLRRVAGQSKNLAKTCATDADWGAAWRASYDAGLAGSWDAVRFLPKPQAPRGRVNHDLARVQARQAHPSAGAAGSVAATAMAMLTAPTRQEDR